MKALFAILSVLLFVISTQAQYGGGTGEPNDPYLIYTAGQLNAIGTYRSDWKKHFKLMADIDLSDYSYDSAVIAGDSDLNKQYFQGTSFDGVFDGNGHMISCLTITGANHLGLFGQLSYGAEVRDLCVVYVNITGSDSNVGGLVGYNDSGFLIRCLSSGSVNGRLNVGGLVGYNGGDVAHCYSSGNVRSINRVGGLVGFNLGKVTACFSTNTVTGNDNVGGLVGENQFGCFVNHCYSTGTVSGGKYVGGLVGMNLGDVINSYSRSMVSGSECVGGLVGQNGRWIFYNNSKAGKILKCYSTGFITGKSNVGGVVGLLVAGNVTGCLWDLEASGQTTSSGGEGKITIEMRTADTFLDTGWDFLDETANGTEDIWRIDEGQDYPRLVHKVSAFSPDSHHGASDVSQPLILCWAPGYSALHHDVYFGEDREAVANATIESPATYRGRQAAKLTTYNPGTLKLAKTYYWRIDEVNQTNPNSPWRGNIWSFTTGNFIVVDDFESYNDADNPTWLSWHDGLGYGIPGTPDGYPGNGTGSAIGNETEYTSVESTIVHGGRQSTPFYYHNNKYWCDKYSEAEKILSYPRDWTEEGVTELSLWFRGYPAAGTFVEEPVGTYIMTGLGADIGMNNDFETDEFHFAYKELTGAGTIMAKVESIENTHEWAKAGVMIREIPYENSKYAFACITPGNGIAFQGRREWDTSSFTTNHTGITAPHWIKLERDAANNFTAYHSSDGSTWEAIGEIQNIQMSTNVYVGLALTSHDSSFSCEAKFSNVTITGSVGPEWADQDIGIVTNDLEPLYVAITNNTGEPAIVYHSDPGASGIDTWTEWVIPLQTFTDQGVDLTDVNSIAIGLGIRGNTTTPGGWGKMYFDDIRLYQPRSEPEPKTSDEFSNDIIYANIKIR
jgi:hypothetical protein